MPVAGFTAKAVASAVLLILTAGLLLIYFVEDLGLILWGTGDC